MPDDGMADVHEKLGRHDQALETGRHKFEEMRESIGIIEGRVKVLEPKSPDWLKVGAFVMSLVIALLAGWWKLSSMFNDRPTKGELAADRADQAVLQEQQGKEIRAIHDQQIVQTQTLEQLTKSAEKTNLRLDQLLDKGRSP